MMIIELILLALAVPTGFLIAWMARDELVDGRRWFAALAVICAVLMILFANLGFGYITLTLVFIAIVSFISLIKSKDERWTKKRI